MPYNFQKHPFRAACRRWTGANFTEIFDLLEKTLHIQSIDLFRGEFIVIRHKRGIHTLKIGDWAIKGEDGAARFYTPEKFALIYEAFQ